MGNNGTKFGDSSEVDKKPNYIFGSIKDKEYPRAGYYYNKKKRIVIYNTEVIRLLNTETEFKKLKYSYAKTNQRVFYKGVSIIGADVDTFSTINRRDIKQLNNAKLTAYNSVIGMDIKNGIKRYYYKGSIVLTE
jgi:hypothetical protein